MVEGSEGSMVRDHGDGEKGLPAASEMAWDGDHEKLTAPAGGGGCEWCVSQRTSLIIFSSVSGRAPSTCKSNGLLTTRKFESSNAILHRERTRS